MYFAKRMGMKPNEKVKPQDEKPLHKKFKKGLGYGSSESDSDFQEHPSDKQYGDNPLPPSGGGYEKHRPRKKH